MKQSNDAFKPSTRLIYEKTIDLNDNEDKLTRTALYIGLNPEDKFHIYGRLEKLNTGDCFMLKQRELEHLLKFAEDYEKDIFDQKPVGQSNIGDRFVIYGNQQTSAEILSYCDGRRMTLENVSLMRLINTTKYINRFIYSLKSEILKSEKLYILLLNNFCLGKSTDEACKSVWSHHLRNIFFEHMIYLKCDCTSQNFTSEIALKFESWFAVCVPFYLKTIMMIESERLSTFQLDWPHFWHYVSTEEMAKCGLYYTGTNDTVKCAFCGTMMNKWERSVKPILTHYKINPKCPFLCDFRKSSNISDLGEEELDELMIFLRSKM